MTGASEKCVFLSVSLVILVVEKLQQTTCLFFFLFQIHFRAIGEGASIGDGDDKYVTHPLIDNYNTVMLSACNRVTRTRA